MTDITKTETNILSRPNLVTDIDSSMSEKDMYSHARNLTYSTINGNIGTLSNESSTLKCLELTKTFKGSISLPNNQFLIFSSNGTSELGIFNEKDCSYSVVYTSETLGLEKTELPIIGVSKKDFNNKTVVIFGNKELPIRRIIIEDLSKITDESSTLLFKNIQIPSIKAEKQPVGNLKNGTYSFAIAYTINEERFSDVYSLTKRMQIFSESEGASIQLVINDLDTEFSTYQLIMVGNIDGVITSEVVGNFSTKINTITVSDFNLSTRLKIPVEQLVIRKASWSTAGIITANSNYLVLADLVRREEKSFQKEAMEIEAEYVIEQVPLDFYQGISEDIGYYRDEVYDFGIEGVYPDGTFTNKCHIAGRKATSDDRAISSGEDIENECGEIIKKEKWQVENTAGLPTYENNDFVCNRRIRGYGKLGYFESTYLYPDNELLYGEDRNTPIRYFRFPDECKVPRYEVINGKTYINILGIRFKNIQLLNDPDIVGYRITRSERDRTIIARGLATNVRGYFDKQNNTNVLYTNYPVNDLKPDVYLSETQTSFKNNSEKNFKPLTKYYNDKFNFYSPHCSFNERYVLGNEFNFESEEGGVINGSFENVQGHPEHKLLSQSAFWIASAIGALEYAMTLIGKSSSSTETDIGITTGVRSTTDLKIESVDDLLKLNIPLLISETAKSIAAGDAGKVQNIITILITSLQVITSLGVKLIYGSLQAINRANEVIDIIQRALAFTQYAKQFNGEVKFLSSRCVDKGNKRRRTSTQPTYLSSDLHSIGNDVYNNFMREETVLVQLTKEVQEPTLPDEGRFTISSAKICNTPSSKITKPVSAFYATSKVNKPGQYGQLGSFPSVIIHNEILKEETTPVLYGGDCIIAEFNFMKKMKFFSQDLSYEFGNEAIPNYQNSNLMTGVEYDYKLYRNIAYPRYWIDSTKYDYSQLLRRTVVSNTTFSRTTASKYNLDCKSREGTTDFRVDAYFYLSNNCAVSFITEVDYNINFRKKGDNRHYSKSNTNLSLLFRPQISQFPEKFELSKSFYNIYSKEVFTQQIRPDFSEDTKFPSNQENSVIYSLPSYNLQNVDNWQYFLPLNFFSFREGDFGRLTSIHKIDQDRLIFTFTESSPFISMGRDILELDGSGRKVTIGDGGLFAQDPREVAPTETSYGGTDSRYAFKNTHLGRFYPSTINRHIYIFEGTPQDITSSGIYFWAQKYMPIQLKEYFPSYDIDNPLAKAGYLMAMDSMASLIYITKRDYIPKFEDIVYSNNKFYYGGVEISLKDTVYFEDISWTASYSPIHKKWVSFHDWHPDWIIQTNNHFISVKNNTLWKHNERYDSFCEFYGKQYPFEIEFVSNSGKSVEIVRNIEYQIEAYKYKNNGRDKFHILNENFDKLIVSNSEQLSPILDIKTSSQNPYKDIEYPKRVNNTYEILYTKEENKYRINQFWDSTKDRGEFTNTEYYIFKTSPAGYKKEPNLDALNLDKKEEERKKFRHYWTKFWFLKLQSNDVQFIIKMFDTNKTISIR